MKFIDFYSDQLNCKNKQEVFTFLIDNLKDTIKGWDYFVDWGKVKGNVNEIEISLNIMNYLIGKENIEEEFKSLIQKYPQIINVIPILIASREKKFTVLDPIENNIFNFKEYSFNKRKLSFQDIEDITNFVVKSKILQLFKDKNIKNVVDYVTGIEVGLDSNARKNRSGTSMEYITELYIKKICKTKGYKYLKQATSGSIKNELGFDVAVDKNNRRFDFALTNGKKLYLIETNYYSGGGSKLKATAGEYKALFDYIKENNSNHEFIWITDGKGWLTAKNPLEETFLHIDYVLNLEMLEKGILEVII